MTDDLMEWLAKQDEPSDEWLAAHDGPTTTDAIEVPHDDEYDRGDCQ